METHLLSQSVCCKCFLVEINKENPTYRDMQLKSRGVFLQSFQIIVHIYSLISYQSQHMVVTY